jgi:hypothetical protein
VVALEDSDPSVCTLALETCRCSRLDIDSTTAPDWVAACENAGSSVVPVPAVLADVALCKGNAAGVRSEAALANDMVFVGTSNPGGGHVYALAPRPTAFKCP